MRVRARELMRGRGRRGVRRGRRVRLVSWSSKGQRAELRIAIVVLQRREGVLRVWMLVVLVLERAE